MTDGTLNHRTVAVHERADNDWYVEPGWCWDLLLAHERFAGGIRDPCCGSGTGPMALQRAGYERVTATDIVDRGYARFDGQADFFRALPRVDPAADNIASNPPYDRAPEFLERALQLARHKVALLVQEKFPYSQSRYRLFAQSCLARLYFFSTRPSMPPGHLLEAGAIEATGGSINYLWMVWDHAHRGPPTAHWLHRAPPAAGLFDGSGKAA